MDIAQPAGHRPRRLVEAFSSPDSYGLVLLLILLTYALSAIITAAWAVSLVLFVQIATVWVTLRVSRARRLARVIANAILVISAIAAMFHPGDRGHGTPGRAERPVVPRRTRLDRASPSAAAWVARPVRTNRVSPSGDGFQLDSLVSSYSRMINAAASRSRSTSGSPLTSTADRLRVPPVNRQGRSAG